MPLPTVLREIAQKLVADDWFKVLSDDGTACYFVIGAESYRAEFLKLFGFGLRGVDYEKETDPVQPLPSAAAG